MEHLSISWTTVQNSICSKKLKMRSDERMRLVGCMVELLYYGGYCTSMLDTLSLSSRGLHKFPSINFHKFQRINFSVSVGTIPLRRNGYKCVAQSAQSPQCECRMCHNYGATDSFLRNTHRHISSVWVTLAHLLANPANSLADRMLVLSYVENKLKFLPFQSVTTTTYMYSIVSIHPPFNHHTILHLTCPLPLQHSPCNPNLPQHLLFFQKRTNAAFSPYKLWPLSYFFPSPTQHPSPNVPLWAACCASLHSYWAFVRLNLNSLIEHSPIFTTRLRNHHIPSSVSSYCFTHTVVRVSF